MLVQTKGVINYDGEHSLLSASRSLRWIACPISLSAEASVHRHAKAAEEGTWLHEISRGMLANRTPAPEVGDKVEFDGISYEFTEEHLTQVTAYVDYVQSLPWTGGFDVETRVFYNKSLGVARNLAFGTCDAKGFVQHDDGTIGLYVVDAKFGRIPVKAKNNTQLILYAAGVVELYRSGGMPLASSMDVTLAIYQPRVSKQPFLWRTSVREIEALAFNFRDNAQAAVRFYTGVGTPQDFEEFPEMLGSHCVYCPRKPLCHALNEATTICATAEIVEWNPEIFKAKNAITSYLDMLEEEALGAALAGAPLEGTKLVRGRAGRAQLNAAPEEIRKVARSLGVEKDVVEVKEVWASPANIRNTLKSAGADRKVLNNLIVNPPGRPLVVLSDDPRPELEIDTDDVFVGEQISL